MTICYRSGAQSPVVTRISYSGVGTVPCTVLTYPAGCRDVTGWSFVYGRRGIAASGAVIVIGHVNTVVARGGDVD